MTPAPVWSRLLVSLTSCALMALGLRDMLAPGLVLQSVPGDAQLQAVWGSLGEGWARQHAQHIAGVFWVFTSIMKLVEIGRDEHNLTLNRAVLGVMDAGLLYFLCDLFFQEMGARSGNENCLRPLLILVALEASTLLLTCVLPDLPEAKAAKAAKED